MSHDMFKPSNLIGCLENKTADSAQTRKRAIVTRPFPSTGGQGLGTRLTKLQFYLLIIRKREQYREST